MTIDSKIQHSKQASFVVFRFQLVVDKALQMNMYDYKSAEDIRADKNNILQKLLTNENFRFHTPKTDITSKLIHTNGALSYFKLGVKRSAKVFNKDFSENVIDNYPNIIVAINNDPDIQKIAIQNNVLAFQDCNTVSHIVQKSIDSKVKQNNLSFYIEPIFDKARVLESGTKISETSKASNFQSYISQSCKYFQKPAIKFKGTI